MTSTQKLQARWAKNRSFSALKKAELAMHPHMKLFDTPDGLLARFMVTGFALVSLEQPVSEEDVVVVVKEAAQMSGIPESVWRLQYEAATAMMEAFMLDQEFGGKYGK